MEKPKVRDLSVGLNHAVAVIATPDGQDWIVILPLKGRITAYPVDKLVERMSKRERAGKGEDQDAEAMPGVHEGEGKGESQREPQSSDTNSAEAPVTQGLPEEPMGSLTDERSRGVQRTQQTRQTQPSQVSQAQSEAPTRLATEFWQTAYRHNIPREKALQLLPKHPNQMTTGDWKEAQARLMQYITNLRRAGNAGGKAVQANVTANTRGTNNSRVVSQGNASSAGAGDIQGEHEGEKKRMSLEEYVGKIYSLAERIAKHTGDEVTEVLKVATEELFGKVMRVTASPEPGSDDVPVDRLPSVYSFLASWEADIRELGGE